MVILDSFCFSFCAFSTQNNDALKEFRMNLEHMLCVFVRCEKAVIAGMGPVES